MPLLDLPPEILDSIINFTLPTGFESFVLSCKTVYGRAGTQISYHNSMKWRWQHTSNTETPWRNDNLRILREIVHDPTVAEYIQFLNLWDRRPPENLLDATVNNVREDAETMNAIKQLLLSYHYHEYPHLNDWWGQIESGSALETALVLLLVCPNLKSVQLPDSWYAVRPTESADHLVPLIRALVAKSNSGDSPCRPLANLNTIYPFMETGYEVRSGFQCLQPFMTLKSMRNLFAVSCTALDPDWRELQMEWPDAHVQSPITRMELVSCCIDASGLNVSLAHMPALRIFRYSHQEKWVSMGEDWNAGEFLEVLANHAGDNLVELAITVDNLSGEIINGLSSFMRFPSLRLLEVDVKPFCGPPLESGQRLGRDAFVPDGARAWTHGDIPCLGDMLPPSIEELHINTDYPNPSEKVYESLFKNIVCRREDKLTKLKLAVLRQYASTTARPIAEMHNVTFEGFDVGEDPPGPRSMMPLWKREFARAVGGIFEFDGEDS